MSHTHQDSATAGIVADVANSELSEPADKPTTLTPGQKESSLTLWVLEPDGAEAGIWEASPGTFTAVRDGYHEVCHIVSGRATVTSADGTTVELSPGVAFVMPNGWSGTWQVHETVRKTFVTVDVR